MAAIPRYLEIRDDILGKIRSGRYAEGELIPSEVELATQYGVSRPTIRQALQALADEGYLERKRRRGTIVRRSKIENDFTLEVESFDVQMASKGRSTSTTVLLCKAEEANEEVADRLEVGLGTKVAKLVRLRYVEGEPQVYVTTYAPLEVFPHLAEQDFSSLSLYAYYRGCGHPLVEAARELEVIKADEVMAGLLDVAIGDPLFLFHTVGRDREGRAIEYSIARYRGESNTFEFAVRTPED